MLSLLYPDEGTLAQIAVNLKYLKTKQHTLGSGGTNKLEML